MSHQRTVIRQAIIDRLLDETAAGGRVHATRLDAYRPSELPAIAVFTLREEVDPASAQTAPRELTRTLRLETHGFAAAGTGVDVALDDLAEEIETALLADPSLGGAAGDCVLSSTEIEFKNDGDVPLGVVSLVWTVTYRTLAIGSVATPDEFLRAHVTRPMGGADTADVLDEIDVRGAA